MVLWTFMHQLYVCENMFSALFGIYLGVEPLDHMCNFLKYCQTVSHFQCGHHFTFPQTVCEGSHLSTSLPTLLFSFLILIMAILGVVPWYLTIVLIRVSPMNKDIEQLFLCLIDHLCIFFGEPSIQILYLFFIFIFL